MQQWPQCHVIVQRILFPCMMGSRDNMQRWPKGPCTESLLITVCGFVGPGCSCRL